MKGHAQVWYTPVISAILPSTAKFLGWITQKKAEARDTQ